MYFLLACRSLLEDQLIQLSYFSGGILSNVMLSWDDEVLLPLCIRELMLLKLVRTKKKHTVVLITLKQGNLKTFHMVGREGKRMLPALKNNAATGYQGSVKIELLKGAVLLTETHHTSLK